MAGRALSFCYALLVARPVACAAVLLVIQVALRLVALIAFFLEFEMLPGQCETGPGMVEFPFIQFYNLIIPALVIRVAFEAGLVQRPMQTSAFGYAKRYLFVAFQAFPVRDPFADLVAFQAAFQVVIFRMVLGQRAGTQQLAGILGGSIRGGNGKTKAA